MVSKIAVIGAGMMGGAIVKSLLKGGYKGRIIVADAEEKRLIEMNALGLSATSDNQKAAAQADIVFIVVKPSNVERVLKGISQELRGKIVVSVAATVPIEFLKKILPKTKFIRIIRVYINSPS